MIGAPEEVPRAQGGRRGWTGALFTGVVAVALCWWSLRGVRWGELLGAFREIDPAPATLAIGGYTAAFLALDSAGFVLVYRAHLAPRVPVRHVVTIVAGKQLLGLVFPLLTKLVAPVYFRRRWRVPALRTLGATEVLTVADAIVLVAVIAAGSLVVEGLPASAVPAGALLAAGLAAFLLWAWLPAGPRVLPRLRESAFLSVLMHTSPREMAAQILLRAGLVAAMGASWWLLLRGAGVDLGGPRLVQFCAIFLLATQLPISVGGYGGAQGVCVLLLADSWQTLSRVDAVTLSLVWSTGYLLARLIAGAAFAIPLSRLLRAGPADGGADDRAD